MELEREPSLASIQRHSVKVEPKAYGRSKKIWLQITHGNPHYSGNRLNVSLSPREVDDLVTMLLYYKLEIEKGEKDDQTPPQ